MLTRKNLFQFLAFALLLIVSTNAFSQQKITGTVFEKPSDSPISLAEVFVSGTTIGPVTDENDRFELRVPYLPCQIIFNHVSYTPVVYTAMDAKNISVALTPVNLND